MFPRGFRWAEKNTEKFWWEKRRTDRRSEGPKAGILSARLDQSELGGLEQRGQENRNEEVWS